MPSIGRINMQMNQYACDKCGHEWGGRKPELPQKCPRCQSLSKYGHIRVVSISEFASVSNPYVVAVSEILATGTEPWASAIKGIVDAHRATSTTVASVKPSRKAG